MSDMPMTKRGPWWFALRRIKTMIRPDVIVTPAPASIIAEWDVPITVRDGTVLKVNVFRPAGEERVPVIMSAHPYGKDAIPAHTRSRRSPNLQYHFFPAAVPTRFSEWTSWEAPDPVVWVQRGYAVINCDLRGTGKSGGTGEFLSELDRPKRPHAQSTIEWAAAQPWSTGKVGLDGVSYLCVSQYFAAAQRPPHLAAICPWEGFTDVYRDFVFPGGVREKGFSALWFTMTGRSRVKTSLKTEVERHPDRDAFWIERVPAIEKIEVPMLLCTSFSDHSLHTRGTFEAFRRAGSTQKWIYTHRGGKWCTYYGDDATQTRIRFFDHFLKGLDNGWEREPAARIAIHEFGDAPAVVTKEATWPPGDLNWHRLYLDASTMTLRDAPGAAASARFHTRKGRAAKTAWTVPEDLDVIGPMALRVPLEMQGADDVWLFAGVRKFADGAEVLFEGSDGWGRDLVSKGWQRAAHRELDAALATPSQPVHTHARVRAVAAWRDRAGPTLSCASTATRSPRGGGSTVIELRGTWFFARDPLRGQFPAWYLSGPAGMCVVHTGEGRKKPFFISARGPRLAEPSHRATQLRRLHRRAAEGAPHRSAAALQTLEGPWLLRFWLVCLKLLHKVLLRQAVGLGGITWFAGKNEIPKRIG